MYQSCSNLYQFAGNDMPEIKDYVEAVRNNPKGVSSLSGTLTLDCQISKSALNYPVCHVDCKHEMYCVDLLSVTQEIKKLGKFQCPIKNCKAIFKKDKAKEQLKVSFIHSYVRLQLHNSAREGIYIIKENLEIFVCSPYFGTKLTIFNTYFKQLKHLVNQPIYDKGQFKQLYQATPNEINFYAVCIMGLCKINIPVRHKNCQHTDAYDWISLMNYTTTIQKVFPYIKHFICLKTGCKSVFSVGEVDLQHDLAIDYDLLTSINQGVPFCFNFRISNQGELNLATVHSIDPHIVGLCNYQGIMNEVIQTFQAQCYRQADQLIKQSRPYSYEKLLLQTIYDKYQVGLLDPITQYIIKVPVRCINCKNRKQVADIMTYLFKLQTYKVEQEKLEKQNPIAIKKYFTCFLCQADFKVIYSKDLTSQIYVDTQFLEQIMKYPAQWIQHCLIKMNGRDLIKEQLISTKKIAFEQYIKEGKNQILYPFLKCALTGKRLVTPIIMKNCKHPGTYVDYDEVYNLLNENWYKFESLRNPCSFCDAPKSFDDYMYDELFGSLLKKLTHIHVDKGVKFDTRKRQFVEMPSEQILKEIAQLNKTPLEQFEDLFKEVKVGNSTFQCIGFNDGSLKIDQNGINADGLKKRVAEANEKNSKFTIVGVKFLGIDVLNLQPCSNNGQEYIEEFKQQALLQEVEPLGRQLGNYDVDINKFNQIMILTYRNQKNSTLQLENHYPQNEFNHNPPILDNQIASTMYLVKPQQANEDESLS